SNLKLGSARVFNGLGEFYGVAVTGVGPNDATMNSKETLNECKENIRIAAAVGAKALQDQRPMDTRGDQSKSAKPRATTRRFASQYSYSARIR
ncbi:unnamed protein product, partial [Nesidiocoris tenuis]